MINNFKIILILSWGLLISACGGENKNNKPMEDYKTGSINISVDESFRPIFREMEKVFSASYPDGKINITYKSEEDCIKDWFNDSVRLVFCTKRVSPEESSILENNLGFRPAQSIVAYDALAVVLNKKNKDTLLDIADIKKILAGQDIKYKPVVDGLTQSSALRYIREYIFKNESLDLTKIKGAPNSEELINTIAQNENYVGFIGVNWVGNKEDSLQASFNKKIKIAAIACSSCEKTGVYVKPYQAILIQNEYPFLREVRYVLKENYIGLGRGFVNFVSNERGQLIFKRSYIVPAKMNFNVRKMKI